MLDEQNTKKPRHKLVYHAKSSEDFQRALDLAKEMFGHRGKENGWWWTIQGRFRDKVLVFKFNEESDATFFKMCL